MPLNRIRDYFLLRRRMSVPHFAPPFPKDIDGRIDQQLQDETRDDPTHHWGGDAFHHIGACSTGPHDGQEAHQDREDGHHLGPNALELCGNVGDDVSKAA